MGYFADDGLVVCGRAKEIIAVAGRNGFPTEIQRVAAGCAAYAKGLL